MYLCVNTKDNLLSDNTTRRNGNLSDFAFLKPLNVPTIYLISFKAQGKCELYSENVSAVYFPLFCRIYCKAVSLRCGKGETISASCARLNYKVAVKETSAGSLNFFLKKDRFDKDPESLPLFIYKLHKF